MSAKESNNEEIIALIRAVRDGGPDSFTALRARFTPLIERMIGSFIKTAGLQAEDRDDLRQEADLCLYKAALRYDLGQTKVTFGLYAKICLKNRMISVARHEQRKKRKKNAESRPDKNRSAASPREEAFSDRRRILEANSAVLSQKERAVFLRYLSGMRYADIANELEIDYKSVDNALRRAKAKLRSALDTTQ